MGILLNKEVSTWQEFGVEKVSLMPYPTRA
jgi:hypothetical protein